MYIFILDVIHELMLNINLYYKDLKLILRIIALVTL